MSDGLFYPDGTPRQSATRRVHLGGQFPTFTFLGLVEGVVLRAYYKDDVGNVSGVWTEYDIMHAGTREIYRNARIVNLFGAPANGAETTLAETTATTDGNTLILEDLTLVKTGATQASTTLPPTPTYKLNGERVLFGFLSGSHLAPVIVGAFPHPASTYSATREQAPRRFERYNGWTFQITNEGVLSFVHDDGRHLRFNTDGSADLVQASGAELHLGEDGASASAVRGETNNENINKVIEQIASPIGPTALIDVVTALLAASLIPEPAKTTLGGVLTDVRANLALIQLDLPTALSPTVKVP